jgi:hemoglobin
MGVRVTVRGLRGDLDDRTEIAEMVRRFYADVAQDDLLGPIFNVVARVDWSEHLPKLAAFWCRALLSIPGYEGNPYRVHQLVHGRQAFTAAHFERWLDLFHETLDLGWSGPNVEKAKALARRVAEVHCRQLVGSSPGFTPLDGPGASGQRS